MTPRKHIPHAASGLIDQAKMDVSAVAHLLMPLVRCKANVEERVSLPAQAVINCQNIIITLDELRGLVKKGEPIEPSPAH
jgi:hypothetical protein